MRRQFNLFFLLLLFFTLNVHSQSISYNAMILTLRLQNGIWLDSTLAYQIDSALNLIGSFDEKVNECDVFPNYDPYDLVVKTDSAISSWNSGILSSGIPKIDSLNDVYKAISVRRVLSSSTYYTLTFEYPLKIENLKSKYLEIDQIVSASVNGYLGDGDNIYLIMKPDGMHFIFKFGWGDCMSGCACKEYWYYSLDLSNNVVFEEYLTDEHRKDVKIFLWNIPSEYPVTMFPNPDSIYSMLRSTDKWWIKKHCIEGIYRLYRYDYQWNNNDLKEQFDSLRQAVVSRLSDNLSIIQEFFGDQDSDVANVAHKTYNYLITLEIEKNQISLSNRFQLYPLFPNPFNSATTIHYSLFTNSDVTIMIFNINGQNVESIPLGRQCSGDYFVNWVPNNLTSGIYFIQLQTNNFQNTRKCIYLR